MAAYLRVSTEEQAREGLSLDAQDQRIRAFAASQGWEVTAVYRDDGYSGKDLRRPEIQRLVSDASLHRYDVVLVWRLDRLSRRQRDVLWLLEEVFEPQGVGLKSVTEAFDTTTSFGRAMLGMLAVFAQLEREAIVERSRLGKAQAARMGRWKGGPRPFGLAYDPDVKQLLPHPTEAPLALSIFDAYVNKGMGVNKIAASLRAAGHTLSGGGNWTRGSVLQVLNNAALAGFVRHGDMLYDADWAPVVPRELWTAAQTARGARKRQFRTRRSDRYLLSGILRCDVCGTLMSGFPKAPWRNPRTGETRGEWRYYYVCRARQDREYVSLHGGKPCPMGYMRADELEPKVLEYLFGVGDLPHEQIRRAVLATVEPEVTTAQGPSREEQVSDIDRRLARLLAALEDGSLEAAVYRTRTTALKARRAEILAEGRKPRTSSGYRAPDLDATVGILTSLRRTWPLLGASERDDVLHTLVREVRVQPGGRFTVTLS